MSGELMFVILIAAGVVIVALILRAEKKRKGDRYLDWGRFYLNPEIQKNISEQAEQIDSYGEAEDLAIEEDSKVELKRLQKLINARKKIAWETDISYHVWNLYRSNFRNIGPYEINSHSQDGKWYELKILRASNINDLKKFEFELSGVRYKFVDDEDKQKTADNIRLFNLCLYDDTDRCLMDIPMKLRVDDSGKSYSVSSDSPKAFILGSWIKEFINVSLKHQNIRNQEIRAQKHQERLREIEELKEKFGISE